ncbi:hypothetical protein PG997_001701 [Apiospora hydei]|uniref:Peptidase S8/S53 domain-containing protein n=1 Tax=Apiospora hydei TaxID=1337664 RepID=A0ABR1XE84_9PEZI
MRLPVPAAFAGAALAAPFIPRSTQFTAEAAKDGWIVVMKDDAPHHEFLRTRDVAMAAGAAPRYTFDFGEGLLRGHVMRGPGSEIAVQSMADSEHIAFIQPDTPFTLDDFEVHNETAAPYNSNGTITGPPPSFGSDGTPWGLHRISHGPLTPNTTTLEYRANSTGRSTAVYVVDTGITLDHPQFGGRARWGGSFLQGIDQSWMPAGGDDNGHGTRKFFSPFPLLFTSNRQIAPVCVYCAGTIGGATLGVAREANLVALKVINRKGSGHPSNVLRALEWAINDATANNRLEKSVISMSLGGLIAAEFLKEGRSDVNMVASRIASKKGIFVVAAAGNDRRHVDLYTPQAEPEVCTIGAIDKNDAVARFSNYGAGMSNLVVAATQDLYAPGVAVLSAWPGNKTRLLDGTSMACPHVSGLGAYMMDLDGPDRSTPGRQMCERLKGMATYRKGREGKEPPSKDFVDDNNKYTKVASNGMAVVEGGEQKQSGNS